MKINNKTLEWSSSYELGIPDIDYQHHYFFNLISRLSEELINSDSFSYKALLLSELAAYARFHFLSEENFMLKHDFPEIEQHKLFHLDLLDKLSVKANYIYLEDDNHNNWAIISFLVDWFLHHTSTIDKEFANHLRDKNKTT